MSKLYLEIEEANRTALSFVKKIPINITPEDFFDMFGIDYDEDMHQLLFNMICEILKNAQIPPTLQPKVWACPRCKSEMTDYLTICDSCLENNNG